MRERRIYRQVNLNKDKPWMILESLDEDKAKKKWAQNPRTTLTVQKVKDLNSKMILHPRITSSEDGTSSKSQQFLMRE